MLAKFDRRRLYFFLLLLVLTLTFMQTVPPAPTKAVGEAWLNGWQYRRKITITENSGTNLTDYQVLVNLTAYNLTGAQSSCADVRFTDSDGSTLLSFWRESCAGTAAGDEKLFWVKVPSIPASSSVTIYMYYGNANAADASNVTATFIDDIDGLVAAWNLNEGSGTVAHDSSGNGNDGTLNGSTWVDGKYNKALYFDGSDDYVEVPNSDSLNPIPITIQALIKPPHDMNAKAVYGHVVVKYNEYCLHYDHDSLGLSFAIRDSGGNWHTISWTDGQTFPANNWYLLTAIYDGSDMLLYVNTQSVSNNIGSVSWDTETNDIEFSWDTGDNYIEDTIDSARIFNKTLSSQQIADIYNNYGYTSSHYLGHLLVRKYVDPEPALTIYNGITQNYIPINIGRQTIKSVIPRYGGI